MAKRLVAKSAAQAAGKAGGKAASIAANLGSKSAVKVLAKAGPVLGVISAAASAIDPIQWDSFTQKQNRINNIDTKKNTSSKLLVKHLQKSLDREKGHYVGRTATDAALTLVGAGLMASGVGIPAALALFAVQAAISGLLLAVEEGEIKRQAKELRDELNKIGGGGSKGVQNYFDKQIEE